jgi:mitochondrial fission protein ELM1
LQSAISHLRPEGREIVAIVLSGPAEMYDWSAPQITPKSHHLKLYLKALGWSDKKIKSGFNDIKRMLQEI